MIEQVATVSHWKDSLVDLAIRFGPRLLTAIVILIIGLAVSRSVSGWLARMLHRRALEPPIRLLLTRLVWRRALLSSSSWRCRIWASSCCP